MYWVDDQESSFWRRLGWELLDFYDDDVQAPWKIVKSTSKHISDKGLSFNHVLGTAMMGLGAAVLVPGPVDAAAAAAGVALFKHPAGAIVGIVAYNAFGLALIGTGHLLVSS